MRTMQELLDAAEDYARNYRCPDELRRPIFLQHLTWLSQPAIGMRFA